MIQKKKNVKSNNFKIIQSEGKKWTMRRIVGTLQNFGIESYKQHGDKKLNL